MEKLRACAIFPMQIDEKTWRNAMKPDGRTKELKETDNEQRRLSSVTNAMRLLKTFSDERYEIGIIDLGTHLQLSKSTVHRLAVALVDTGLLEQNPKNSKYRLGGVILELSYVMQHGARSSQ